jgi:5-oxoprolinase (ATP-hydrolysing)
MRESNFNAPKAVTRAVVLYVFRCLVAADIPLNEGCLRPLDIVIPEGSMLSPEYPAAVVAGNVEVSQAIADTLFAALGVLAASQGTMNNFTFGNARYQHYETLCGGAGAGEGFAGASAVHTHMTNSRLTDPEILETRFPVRLLSFSIRRGSGGEGHWCGGDGVVRRVEFLEPMTANLLANRYRTQPFGVMGGGAGLAGQALVVRGDGSQEPLTGIDSVDMDRGDIITIATPGGGAFGPVQHD